MRVCKELKDVVASLQAIANATKPLATMEVRVTTKGTPSNADAHLLGKEPPVI